MRRRVLLCFVLALASGCQGDDATKPMTTSAPPPPSRIISDGNHSGNPDFFFLPPMVPNPSGSPNWNAAGFDGSYVGGRAPIVNICQLPASTTEENIAAATCPGGSPLLNLPAAVDIGSQQYQLNWRVPDVSVTTFYRVTVILLGQPIGIADVEVVPNASQLKYVQGNDVVPLADNRTLPIKFRLQHNVLCNGSMPAGFCPLPVDLSTGGTVQTTLPGGTLPSGVIIPSDAGTGTVNIAVEPCESFRYRATDLPVFGPCVRITSTPQLTTALANSATVFVCDVSKLSVSADVLDDDQAERITLHQLDPDNSSPSGQVLRALPHAAACGESSPLSSRADASIGRLLAALRHLDVRDAARQAAALLAPKPLYAARFIDLGGGGSTAFFSDFQFALPASMQVVASTNNQEADPGQALPSPVSVLVSDLGGKPVRNARVTFAIPDGGGSIAPLAGPAADGTSAPCPASSTGVAAMSGIDGLASVQRTLGATPGSHSLRAIGRGIGGDDISGPRSWTDPFQPIQPHFDGVTPPGGVAPVVVQTGSVPISAFGWAEVTVCSDAKTQVVSGPGVTPGNAFVITPNPAYATPISGSVWIGPVANSGTSNLVPGVYAFHTDVFASHNAVLNGSIMADNGAVVQLNAQTILEMGAFNQGINPPASAFQQVTSFSQASGFTNGMNSIDIQLVNTGFSIGNSDPNPTALDYCISVTHPRPAQVPSE